MAWGAKTEDGSELLQAIAKCFEKAGFSASRDVINGTPARVFRTQIRPTLFVHDFAGGVNVLAFVKLNKEKAKQDRVGFLTALSEMNSKTIALIVSSDDDQLILSHWFGSFTADGFEAFMGCFDHDMQQFVMTSMLGFTL